MKKVLLLLSAALLLALVFVGCASPAPAPAPTPVAAPAPPVATPGAAPAPQEAAAQPQDAAEEDFNETSVINFTWHGNDGSGFFVNPWRATQNMHQMMVFESLVRRSACGNDYFPYLAASWEVSADGLTYTFQVRDTSVWSDGTPLTMDDVIFSFARRLVYPVFVPAAFTFIEGAQDVMNGYARYPSGVQADGWTLTVTLTQPRIDFMPAVPQLAILPRHLLGHVDNMLEFDRDPFWLNPVGSGPYVIDVVNPDNFFTVVLRDDYVGAYSPRVRRAVFTDFRVGGTEAVAAAFIAGNLDFAKGSIVNDLSMARNVVANNPDVSYKILPSTFVRALMFNMTGSTDGSAFNESILNPDVRHALNLLLDKEAIASMYGDQATVLTTYFSPYSPYFNTDIPLFQRDVETARALLEAADFDFSLPIRIAYHYTNQATQDIMAIITANFAEVGIMTEPFLMTGDVGGILHGTRPYELVYVALSAGQPDVMIGGYANSAATFNANNNIILGNVEEREEIFNHIIDAYMSATDNETKMRLRWEMQALAHEHMYVIPKFVLHRVILLNTANWEFDEDLFGVDVLFDQDWMYSSWNLLR